MIAAVIAAILGRRPAPPEPEPWRVPVPSPARSCPVHDVQWNGDGDCWLCEPSPLPQPSRLEES